LPNGVRVYAIGDVHGRADLLEQVLARIDADLASRPASDAIQIFLGDYIDRGPQSRQVLDRLIGRGRTRKSVFLKGNHETYIGAFLKNPLMLTDWRRLGGMDTLLSYGLTPPVGMSPSAYAGLAATFAEALPANHRQFLGALRPSFTLGDFFFVHAGVRPGIALQQQREDDLLWIRDDFLLHEGRFEKIIVHGHTPVQQPDIRHNRINIDTGAYATGRLTCLRLEGETVSFL
jgi:serine/threonine protein phosphatase 1